MILASGREATLPQPLLEGETECWCGLILSEKAFQSRELENCSAADTAVKQKAGSVLVTSRAAEMLTASHRRSAVPCLSSTD